MNRIERLATLLLVAASPLLHAAGGPTSTTLTASSTTFSSGTVLTLTAAVAPVTPGLVRFCENANCSGTNLLGTSQVTGAGTAVLRSVPASGTHVVTAYFAGTSASAPSSSAAITISVSGKAPTVTTLASSGAAGNYSLNATLKYKAATLPNGGEAISFTDTTNGTLALGQANIIGLTAPEYLFTKPAPAAISSGDITSATVSADFNNDGLPDAAVASFATGSVRVLLGDGTGGFAAASGADYAAGAGVRALAVADFNSDGNADLAIVNDARDTVVVLLGDGRGGFASGGTAATGRGAQSITIADFNADGIPDLAVTNGLDTTITVLLGNGAGAFRGTPATYSVGNNPGAIASADFNGDGAIDLAVANLSDGTVTLLINNGAGIFTASSDSPIAAIAYPTAVLASDLNADGKFDIAIASGTLDQVQVMLNSGTTVRATGAPIPVGASPSAMTATDLNRDGKLDLVVLNANGGTASALLGDGSGGFSANTQTALSGFSAPQSLAMTDSNGDGTPDLLAANLGAGTLSVRPLLVSQTATATLAPVTLLGGGNHTVIAAYPGDADYLASTSDPLTLSGSLVPTTLSLMFSANPIVYGQIGQATASLTPPTSGNLSAGGTAEFIDGTQPLGQAAITNGQGVVTLSGLGAGAHSIGATYSGDTNFAPSTAPSAPLQVNKAGTASTLALAGGNLVAGQNSTATISVTSLTSGVPTGSITLLDNGFSAGSGTLSNGQASITFTSTTTGTHTYTASYSGDTNFNPSSASAASGTVTSPDFTLALASAKSLSLQVGGTANYVFRITPQTGAFAGPVTFSFTANLPPYATASFSPATIASGSGPTDVTFTISTIRLAILRAPAAAEISAALALLILPFAAMRKSRRKSRRRTHHKARHLGSLLAVYLLTFTSLSIAAMLTGCGTGYANLDVPITVRATQGTVTHTVELSLHVNASK